MIIEDKFGDFFRKLRKARGFKSQKDLAEATGISQASISRIENNSQTPETDTLKVFAKILNYPYADLMVRAGYWDEEDMLGEEIQTGGNLVDIYINKHKKEDSITKESRSKNSSVEFIRSLSLEDEDLLKKFELKLDGKPLTEEEAKGVIAYLRSLREIRK